MVTVSDCLLIFVFMVTDLGRSQPWSEWFFLPVLGYMTGQSVKNRRKVLSPKRSIFLTTTPPHDYRGSGVIFARLTARRPLRSRYWQLMAARGRKIFFF